MTLQKYIMFTEEQLKETRLVIYELLADKK